MTESPISPVVDELWERRADLTPDDLEALADAVREAARPHVPEPSGPGGQGRRGHLRVLRTPTDA